ESSPDCLKVLDAKGRILFMNFNGLCQMEIDDFSTFKNKNWWTLWGSENEALVKASVDIALKGETAQFTALCPTAKGTSKWWDVLVSPVGKPGEPVQQIIAVSRDITEQKKSQEALDKINQMLDLKNIALENANAELKSFSYIASHDLQEPVRMIKMFSKRIIDAEKFSDKTQNYFNFIIAASERMQNLIISLIDYSRIDRTDLNFVPCDLNTIVEESKSDLHLRIVEKQAKIEYENLPTINGLHVQLSQLFTNLISNAIKYSRPEIIPHIKINSERIHGKEISHPAAIKQLEYYTIKIADNGIGFEKEYATKIFEVFQRLHGRNEYLGTGIGLAIVKKIVTNHKGFIIAEGKPGIGSTFTIYIPTS
ncbi:MAG: ATP-binding protein, partial [Chitinophagaceae bacterium]